MDVSSLAGPQSLSDNLNLCLSLACFSLRFSAGIFEHIAFTKFLVASFAGVLLPYNLYVSYEISGDDQLVT